MSGRPIDDVWILPSWVHRTLVLPPGSSSSRSRPTAHRFAWTVTDLRRLFFCHRPVHRNGPVFSRGFYRSLAPWLLFGLNSVQVWDKVIPTTDRPTLVRAMRFQLGPGYSHLPVALCGIISFIRIQVKYPTFACKLGYLSYLPLPSPLFQLVVLLHKVSKSHLYISTGNP